MRFLLFASRVLALILAVWLQTGLLRADTMSAGSVPIGPTLMGTSDCVNAPMNNAGGPSFGVSVTNISGQNWDDFTLLILTCPSGNMTHSHMDGIFFLHEPPPTISVDGGATSQPVTNFSTLSQTSVDLNSEHFNVPLIPPGETVQLTLPFGVGTTTSTMYKLQIIASVPTPEPNSLSLLGLGFAGLMGIAKKRLRGGSDSR
jgi:hypothetical protein